MRLIHTEFVQEHLEALLLEFHDSALYESKFPYAVNMQRMCKCMEIDVKLLIKLTLTLKPEEFGEAGAENFQIYSRWTISTDCLNLRRNRHFFSEAEHLADELIVPQRIDGEEKVRVYRAFAEHLIQRIHEFKFCLECRNLFVDKRDLSLDRMYCFQCMFDRIFFIQELQCVICKDIVQRDEQSHTLTCGHSFHSSCIMAHFVHSKKRECPLCREMDNS